VITLSNTSRIAPVRVRDARLEATRVITDAYDGVQRLTDAVEYPGSTYHYGYDPARNRTLQVVDGTPTQQMAYDAANQCSAPRRGAGRPPTATMGPATCSPTGPARTATMIGGRTRRAPRRARHASPRWQPDTSCDFANSIGGAEKK